MKRKIKKIASTIKGLIKMIFCRHEYCWKSEWIVTSSNINKTQIDPWERHEVNCYCSKCGKPKTYKYMKLEVDK